MRTSHSVGLIVLSLFLMVIMSGCRQIEDVAHGASTQVSSEVDRIKREAEQRLQTFVEDTKKDISNKLAQLQTEGNERLNQLKQQAEAEANRLLQEGVNFVQRTVSPEVTRLIERGTTLANEGLSLATEFGQLVSRIGTNVASQVSQRLLNLKTRLDSLANRTSQLRQAMGDLLTTGVNVASSLVEGVQADAILNQALTALELVQEANAISSELAVIANDYVNSLIQDPGIFSPEILQAIKSGIGVTERSIEVAEGAIRLGEDVLGVEAMNPFRATLNEARSNVAVAQSIVNDIEAGVFDSGIVDAQTITVAPVSLAVDIQPITLTRYEVVRSRTNVRECPAISGCNILGVLVRGDIVVVDGVVQGTLFENNPDWYHTTYNGQSAFIHSNLLQVVNVVVQPVATVVSPTAAPLIVQSSGERIESDSSVVSRTGDWGLVFNDDFLLNSSPNAALHLDFTGTGISILYYDVGSGNFGIDLDNSPYTTVTLSNTIQVQTVTIDNLSATRHSLSIVAQSPTIIDAFVIKP